MKWAYTAVLRRFEMANPYTGIGLQFERGQKLEKLKSGTATPEEIAASKAQLPQARREAEIAATAGEGSGGGANSYLTNLTDALAAATSLKGQRAALQLGPKSTQSASRRRRITPDIFRSTLGTAKELLGKGA